MAGRRTNLGLFALLAMAFATGALAYATGSAWGRWVVAAHGAAGLGIVLLAPWKSVIARRGLRRPRVGRAASLAFGLLVATAVVAGLLHSAGARDWGALTAMQVHVGAALAALPLAAWHVVARRTPLRRTDLDRRNLLRAGAVAGGAGALWAASEGLWRVASLPGDDRRFTGSHEVGSLAPGQMPVTQWLSDSVPAVDERAWRLVVDDGERRRQLAYEELARFDDDLRATLDCTGGWYAEQDWEGVRLSRLLPPRVAGNSLVVRSVTGYTRRFPLGDRHALLLATRAGGLVLSPGHGFPARLVAPGRRGFWWVKWVEEVRVDPRPWWWQPPFPLQ